jgi:SAM-dependent methyltransferase
MEAGSYDEIAEFHDLFMEPVWERLRPVLEEAFGALTERDTVLDIGAGTGVGTRALAQVTDARIIAVEPSLTMRSVLTARVFDDPALRDRVTVVAGSAPGVLAPLEAGSASGFVAAHVLGHLDAGARAALFAELARLLAPGVTGVVTVNRPVHVDLPTPQERLTIGTRTYTEQHVAGEDGAAQSVYTVRDGSGEVVREHRFTSSWESVTAREVAREAACWSADASRPGVVVLRR